MTGTCELVIFDFDGTLVDSQHAIVASMRSAFEREGLPLPEAGQVRSIIGLPLDFAIEQLLGDRETDRISRLAQLYREHARATHGSMAREPEPLMPGARAALDRLEQAGLMLAIATGKGRRGLLAVLEAHGLTNRFISLQSADDGPGKPDPTILRQAIADAGVEPDAAAMVGDTVFDLQAATNAGIKGVGVSWGYHDVDQLMKAQPDAVIDHFDDLDDTLSHLFGSHGGNEP